MRSLANHREITAMLGVPVRRVEAAAWLGSGVLAGATGLLLSTLVGLDIVGLTFLVIASLSAALVGRLSLAHGDDVRRASPLASCRPASPRSPRSVPIAP